MAELDYAFLAEYAQVDPTGKLTAVGASFTRVTPAGMPAAQLFFVAGRVRAREDEGPVALHVEITAPDKQLTIGLDSQLTAGPAVMPYDGKVGLLFAIGTVLPLNRPGLYWVTVSLDGEEVRRLAFDVVPTSPPQ